MVTEFTKKVQLFGEENIFNRFLGYVCLKFHSKLFVVY